jgi:uncharacterized membrane protein YwaF
MERPQSYGAFHLISTAILLAITILGVYLLRKTNDKQNRIVLGVTGGLLILFEIYKILFHVFLDPYGWGGFWGVFPFQLCSLPMYLCVVCAFCKNEKVNSWLYECIFAVNLIGGFMAFVEPSGINHDYWTLTLHAYIWHMSLVFIGMYLIASRRSGTEMSDYKSAVKTFLVLCCIAFIINLSLRKVSDGTVNMFFIGPSVTSLAVFKQISEFTTWYIGTALYIPSVCLGAFIVFYPVHLYAKKRPCKQPQRI